MTRGSTSAASRTVLLAGLAAGTLDILAAFATNAPRGISAVRVLQSVASGLLGTGAFEGGAGTAALGLLLHFVIATSAATVFYLSSRRLGFLVDRPVASGLGYGLAVYGVMNAVVLPLSAIPFTPSYTPRSLVTGLIVHMLCVGLPIALVVRRLG